MSVIIYLFATGLLAGTFGALLGLGGGVIVIPVLTMFFDLSIHAAIGVSLVGVIATSTGAAIVKVREGTGNIRLAMLLELATTAGAIIGAVTAGYMSERVLYFLFAAMLLYNTYSLYQKQLGDKTDTAAGLAKAGNKLAEHDYEVKNVPLGMGLSGIAGVMSGLLGVGGGMIKIPVMYVLMGIPLKVATATSSFMVGITATASAFIYYMNGRIDPLVTVPVALGIFGGANIGLRLNRIVSATALKKIFLMVFVYTAVQMIIKGFGS